MREEHCLTIVLKPRTLVPSCCLLCIAFLIKICLLQNTRRVLRIGFTVSVFCCLLPTSFSLPYQRNVALKLHNLVVVTKNFYLVNVNVC